MEYIVRRNRIKKLNANCKREIGLYIVTKLSSQFDSNLLQFRIEHLIRWVEEQLSPKSLFWDISEQGFYQDF